MYKARFTARYTLDTADRGMEHDTPLLPRVLYSAPRRVKSKSVGKNSCCRERIYSRRPLSLYCLSPVGGGLPESQCKEEAYARHREQI